MSESQHDNEVIAHYRKYIGVEVRTIPAGNLTALSLDPITVLEFAPPNQEYD
jgi:hypothetical protein